MELRVWLRRSFWTGQAPDVRQSLSRQVSRCLLSLTVLLRLISRIPESPPVKFHPCGRIQLALPVRAAEVFMEFC